MKDSILMRGCGVKNKLEETRAALQASAPAPLPFFKDIKPDRSLVCRSDWPSARLSVCGCLHLRNLTVLSGAFVWGCPDPALCVWAECDAERPFCCSELRGWSDADPLQRGVKPSGGGGGGGRSPVWSFSSSQFVSLQHQNFLHLQTLAVLLCELRVASVLRGEIFSLFGFRTFQALPF